MTVALGFLEENIMLKIKQCAADYYSNPISSSLTSSPGEVSGRSKSVKRKPAKSPKRKSHSEKGGIFSSFKIFFSKLIKGVTHVMQVVTDGVQLIVKGVGKIVGLVSAKWGAKLNSVAHTIKLWGNKISKSLSRLGKLL